MGGPRLGPALAAPLLLGAALAMASDANLAAQEREPTQPSTRRLTVSFHDAPLSDVLGVFSDFSGRSIVVGPVAAGVRVTAEIRDQPWDVALEAILEAHGLRARETETGILRVGRLAGGDAPRESATRIFRIRYARADEIASAIGPHLTEGLGRVSVVPGVNAVLVTDTPGKLELVARLIGRPGEVPP